MIMGNCIIHNKTKVWEPPKGWLVQLDGGSTYYRLVKKVSYKKWIVMHMNYIANPGIVVDEDMNYLYANSKIDNYCNNTYYNQLSSNIKNAITDITVQDYDLTRLRSYVADYWVSGKVYDGGQWWLQYVKTFTSITRHIVTPSMMDVVEYINGSTTSRDVLQWQDINYFFYNTSSKLSNKKFNVTVRDSTSVNTSGFVYCPVDGWMAWPGRYYHKSNSEGSNVPPRPMFCIDLKKLKYKVYNPSSVSYSDLGFSL